MPRWKSSILIDIRTSFQPIRCIWKFCIFLLITCGVWWWVDDVKWQSRLKTSCWVYLNQCSTIIQCQNSFRMKKEFCSNWSNWSNWAKLIKLSKMWNATYSHSDYKSINICIRNHVPVELEVLWINKRNIFHKHDLINSRSVHFFGGGWGAAQSWLVCWWKNFDLWNTSRWYFFDSGKGSKIFETPKQCIFGPLYFCHRASQISKSTFERK